MKARGAVDDTRLKMLLMLIFVSLVGWGIWRIMHPRPFWRYQSMTAVTATAGDLEESLRAGVGKDHAEFKQLSPNRVGVTSFGRSPDEAMDLSARLEQYAAIDFQRRGLGRIISTPLDTDGYSDGDPDDFPLWRLHYVTRNLGIPSWHQLFEEAEDR